MEKHRWEVEEKPRTEDNGRRRDCAIARVQLGGRSGVRWYAEVVQMW